jgi:hypothetical protein
MDRTCQDALPTILPDGTNLDGLRRTGYYSVVEPVNGPAAGTYFLEVRSGPIDGKAYTLQIATEVETGVAYTRGKSGPWDAWRELGSGGGGPAPDPFNGREFITNYRMYIDAASTSTTEERDGTGLHPFLDINEAWDYVATRLDGKAGTITFELAPGTYPWAQLEDPLVSVKKVNFTGEFFDETQVVLEGVEISKALGCELDFKWVTFDADQNTPISIYSPSGNSVTVTLSRTIGTNGSYLFDVTGVNHIAVNGVSIGSFGVDIYTDPYEEVPRTCGGIMRCTQGATGQFVYSNLGDGVTPLGFDSPIIYADSNGYINLGGIPAGSATGRKFKEARGGRIVSSVADEDLPGDLEPIRSGIPLGYWDNNAHEASYLPGQPGVTVTIFGQRFFEGIASGYAPDDPGPQLFDVAPGTVAGQRKLISCYDVVAGNEPTFVQTLSTFFVRGEGIPVDLYFSAAGFLLLEWDHDNTRWVILQHNGVTYTPGTEDAGANGGRIVLTAPLDLYVNGVTGNDTTGTGAIGSPFASVEKAWLHLSSNYDGAGQYATIHIAADSYIGIGGVGDPSVYMVGAPFNFSSVAISGTGALPSDVTFEQGFEFFYTTLTCVVNISNIRFENTTGGRALNFLDVYGAFSLDTVEIHTEGAFDQIGLTNGTRLILNSSIYMSGDCEQFIYIYGDSYVSFEGGQYYPSDTYAVADSFVVVDRGGVVRWDGPNVVSVPSNTNTYNWLAATIYPNSKVITTDIAAWPGALGFDFLNSPGEAYHLDLEFRGTVAAGVIARRIFNRGVLFKPQFNGSNGSAVADPPTTATVIDVLKNGTLVGNINISDTGVVTFTTVGTAQVYCIEGDILTFEIDSGSGTIDLVVALNGYTI